MSTTAYSVDRCQGTYDYSSGTTYYYSTTRSHHDRLTTRPCGETVALHPDLSCARTYASEARCRHISLTDRCLHNLPENARRDAFLATTQGQPIIHITRPAG
ncbi:MAG: hypothetical protein SOW36_03390 [Porphyromonas sp.]|uniref:hypothetical protein n=1 Tax=Porphyromonas sp. TaxID=1924944 RepID=UPI002A761921|nr:hypothetical protein [Porphyromonas sp.]MDD6928251.1 hypothetical protein [Bacteroidales bacterium]MDY3111675.1 hypothetical protein [Porphyromonas sp.]MDY4245773.1 hypothetical protein [Porphyromonas sp.]